MKKFSENNTNSINESKEESIEIEAWATFTDGQDGSYNIHLFGTREEAVEDIGTDSPQTLYDDGGFQKFKLKLVQKDGVWTIKKGGVYIPFE